MINPSHKQLSIKTQCRLLQISRSGWYYKPCPESAENLHVMRLIDEQFLQTPYYGSRQMARHLRRFGHKVGRHRVRRLMRLMNLEAIYQRPRTSVANPQHKVYPYLLKGLNINRPNQVWCTDITYIPIKRGFLYLVAIMDWYSRKILAWRIANTMDTRFCLECLDEALRAYGTPEIFNSDQGSQFTSMAFTEALKQHGIKISMDGKGRWIDNVLIERFWRSVKYECVYPGAFESGLQAKQDIAYWIHNYNHTRPHSVFDGQTPNEVYNQTHDQNSTHDHHRLAA